MVLAGLWLGRERGTLPPQSAQTEPQPSRASPPGPAAEPQPAPTAAVAPAARPSFDVVRVNPMGDAVIAGRAAPGAEVSVRDGATEIGHARADSQGEWVVTLDKPLPPGKHDLSIEAQAPGGAVATSQDKVTFNVPEPKSPAADVAAAGGSSPPQTAAAATSGTVTVQRGGTLWGIARDSYGSGTRFTTIYTANRDRISNPDLIFPGQVVTLPAER
ncbi:MAG: ygaU [Rhodospirillales bacterium]|nr:ygaU [Rhodospirillales bacterium]